MDDPEIREEGGDPLGRLVTEIGRAARPAMRQLAVGVKSLDFGPMAAPDMTSLALQ